ncbi:MAG: hypothetical protein RL007_600, partial [Bacteroidota bacterium]
MSKKSKPEIKLNFNEGWLYAPAPESSDHIRLEKKYGHFINGEFVAPASGKYFTSYNPSTEKAL